MGDEVRADPAAIVRLAEVTLSAADAMSDAWSAAQGVVASPVSAFGNAASGPALTAAVDAAEAGADATWRTIVGVYEGDVDKLYRIAFAYQAADRAAAERQRRARGGRQPI
jgi:hypothetical protein